MVIGTLGGLVGLGGAEFRLRGAVPCGSRGAATKMHSEVHTPRQLIHNCRMLHERQNTLLTLLSAVALRVVTEGQQETE